MPLRLLHALGRAAEPGRLGHQAAPNSSSKSLCGRDRIGTSAARNTIVARDARTNRSLVGASEPVQRRTIDVTNRCGGSWST
jgi:hypothetical protein